MPTAKLTEKNQEEMTTAIETICSRVKYVHAFPMPLDSITDKNETYMSFIPGLTLGHLQALMVSNPEAVTMTKKPTFEVLTLSGQYNVKLSYGKCEVPYLGGLCADTNHPNYKELVEWCHDQYLQVRRYNITTTWACNLINKSSSAGQVNTGIPFLKSYMPPKVEASLSGAMRRSRLPKDWQPDSKKAKILEHLLMVGALLEDPEWDRRFHWPEVTWYQ